MMYSHLKKITFKLQMYLLFQANSLADYIPTNNLTLVDEYFATLSTKDTVLFPPVSIICFLSYV